jgi:uncharacterized protein (TIGR04222 family)
MNPFDLAGPQFLGFFFVLSAVVLLLIWIVGGGAQHQPLPSTRLSDPYGIAYLRAGKEEAARVATVVLIDRGLLHVDGTKLEKPKTVDSQLAETELERWVLEAFDSAAEAMSIVSTPGLGAVSASYEAELTRLGLLPDATEKQARTGHFVIAALLLAGIAVNKIVVAAGRGQSNLFFLIVLCWIAITLAWKMTHRFRTARGDALLKDLRTLFAGLKKRGATLRPGGATAELALLAAVFGIADLPSGEFSHIKKLYPKATTSGSGSSCGGGCGSSCGGDGGGCGGCGGD